jgi:hypothetical protein
MASTRWLASFARCRILVSFSIDPISVCTGSSCDASTMTLEGAASVLLDVRRPDYLGPAFDLCLDLGGEFPGRARDDFEAE